MVNMIKELNSFQDLETIPEVSVLIDVTCTL